MKFSDVAIGTLIGTLIVTVLFFFVSFIYDKSMENKCEDQLDVVKPGIAYSMQRGLCQDAHVRKVVEQKFDALVRDNFVLDAESRELR